MFLRTGEYSRRALSGQCSPEATCLGGPRPRENEIGRAFLGTYGRVRKRIFSADGHTYGATAGRGGALHARRFEEEQTIDNLAPICATGRSIWRGSRRILQVAPCRQCGHIGASRWAAIERPMSAYPWTRNGASACDGPRRQGVLFGARQATSGDHAPLSVSLAQLHKSRWLVKRHRGGH